MTANLLERLRSRADNPNGRIGRAEIPGGTPARFAVTPSAAVTQAERRLGFRLPDVLAQLYVEVGNGGFGPGYGIFGLPGGLSDPERGSVVELYEMMSSDPCWPAGMLAICDWGCAIYSCIDCSVACAPVFTFDPGFQETESSLEGCFAATHSSLSAWLEDWLDGADLWQQMYEPEPGPGLELINPFTGEAKVQPKLRLRRKSGA